MTAVIIETQVRLLAIMSQPRSYNNFPKEPAKRQAKQQQHPKGCCCKRSQCIKNYCDCYQSMTTCSIYCKCIGCRNTEERLAMTVPPKKSTLTAKRERAAALSAKAAAAAAKAGINIHMKPAPGSASYAMQRMAEQVPPATTTIAAAPAKPQVIELPQVDLNNIVVLPPPNAAALAKKPQQAVPVISQIPAPLKEVNILKQPVNAALLDCVLIQATEAEAVGLNEAEVGQVVLYEFARNLQAVIKVYSS